MVSSHGFTFKIEPPKGVFTNLAMTKDGHYGQTPYNVLRSMPKKGCIDIGSFIVKSEMAREVGFKDKSFAADGVFVEKLMERYRGKIKSAKVEQVLFVHN